MRRFVTAVLASVCFLGAGCASGSQADRAAFDSGYAALEAGRWQEAVDGFTRYLRSDPTSAHRGEVYYYRGQALVHLNRRTEAKTDFVRAIGAEPRPPIDQFVRVAIGNLYYEEGSDVKAIEHYTKVISDPDKDVPVPSVLLRIGVSLQRLGKWSLADSYLGHLVEKYPGTPSAGQALRRLHADAFRVQTGAFASMTTAARQAQQVRAAGFETRLGRTSKGGQALSTVQVGRAGTYAEAAVLAQRVRQAGFETLIVP
ncbi:MAG TPA: tetratricopeptide repeat protein [Phycisphaerae bacterium]|nr:tetratricopeptide repeat protein [Phycisphaerae bacterium]